MKNTQKTWRMGLILLLLPMWGKAAGGKNDPIQSNDQAASNNKEQEEKKDSLLGEGRENQQSSQENEEMPEPRTKITKFVFDKYCKKGVNIQDFPLIEYINSWFHTEEGRKKIYTPEEKKSLTYSCTNDVFLTVTVHLERKLFDSEKTIRTLKNQLQEARNLLQAAGMEPDTNSMLQSQGRPNPHPYSSISNKVGSEQNIMPYAQYVSNKPYGPYVQSRESKKISITDQIDLLQKSLGLAYPPFV